MLTLTLKRREAIALVGIAAELSWLPCGVATGEGLPQTEPAKLCDVDCEKELENMPTTTTASGLQYKEIEVGNGPTPPVGFQVAAHYVAMVPSGKVFDRFVLPFCILGKSFLPQIQLPSFLLI